MAPELRRQIAPYSANVAPGTIIVDTAETYLYIVLGEGMAIRYGSGVGREGFTWSVVEQVTRKAEWPDWTPPADMIARQPYLARFTAGGEGKEPTRLAGNGLHQPCNVYSREIGERVGHCIWQNNLVAVAHSSACVDYVGDIALSFRRFRIDKRLA